MQRLRETIIEELEDDNPQTVRGVFYRLVGRGVVGKTENEYQAVIRVLTAMRLDRELPFGWIADNSRWMRKPETYGSLERCL